MTSTCASNIAGGRQRKAIGEGTDALATLFYYVDQGINSYASVAG